MSNPRQSMSEESRLVLAMYENNEFPLVRSTSSIVTHIVPFQADAKPTIKDQLDYFASHAGDPQGFLSGLKEASFYSEHISSYLTGEFNNFLRFMRKCKVGAIEDIASDYKELRSVADSRDIVLREILGKFENFVEEFISTNNEDIEYIEQAFEGQELFGRLVCKMPFSTSVLTSVMPYDEALKGIIADRPGNCIEAKWDMVDTVQLTKGLLLWKGDDPNITDQDRLNFMNKIGRSRMIIAGSDIKVLDVYASKDTKGDIVVNFLRSK